MNERPKRDLTMTVALPMLIIVPVVVTVLWMLGLVPEWLYVWLGL